MSGYNAVEKTPEQKAGIRNTLIWLVGVMALILGLFVNNVVTPHGLSDEALRGLGYFQFPKARPIKDINLVSHTGETVTTFEGNWSLVFFGFTFCPDICPTTLGVLARAVEKMPARPNVYMVSVDPERDTPEQLSHYVPSFDPEFVGLTGDFDDIVNVATQLNVAFGKVPGDEPGTYTVDHTASIVVLNPQGEYAGFIKSPHQANNIVRIVDNLIQFGAE